MFHWHPFECENDKVYRFKVSYETIKSCRRKGSLIYSNRFALIEFWVPNTESKDKMIVFVWIYVWCSSVANTNTFLMYYGNMQISFVLNAVLCIAILLTYCCQYFPLAFLVTVASSAHIKSKIQHFHRIAFNFNAILNVHLHLFICIFVSRKIVKFMWCRIDLISIHWFIFIKEMVVVQVLSFISMSTNNEKTNKSKTKTDFRNCLSCHPSILQHPWYTFSWFYLRNL